MGKFIAAPYEPQHLAFVELQAAQQEFAPLLSNWKYAKSLDMPGYTWTGIADGKVLGCGGIFPAGATRAIAWGLFSPGIGRYLYDITKLIKFHLSLAHSRGFKRIEIHVKTDFDDGHRWAKLLGFTREWDMPYFIHDMTFTMYARFDPPISPPDGLPGDVL